MKIVDTNLRRKQRLLAGWVHVAAVAAMVGSLPGCASVNSMMGGNTREQAFTEVVWDYAKEGIVLDATAQLQLNTYQGEPHTLLLGVYQMADSAVFQKLIADPAALAQSLGGTPGNDVFLQYSHYVVEPGQHVILMIDRVQKARFVGVVAGYYDMLGPASARLFEVPVTYASKGMLSSTWSVVPKPLTVRMTLGPNAIVDAKTPAAAAPREKPAAPQPPTSNGTEIKLDASDLCCSAPLPRTSNN
ncbi:type VI secretion system lipoprotein TssJ [Janthinobacterium sp. PC23-8]|uniref:type VI secretion system lipoprotein TssJ n=1 Tax=Janthinobacterium sp. PC23-8 TaxID=2012679 RepID=UPI001595DBB1|nr:type VI secretion system lipoprotein TssJ [Janthinobacterium sp. PC23-8]